MNNSSVPSGSNDERLLALLNKHRGRRAFLVGNGPSLRISDLDRLKHEITFASNRIFLAFDQTEWRPTYYTICDAVVAKENKEIIRTLPFPKIFADYVRPILGDIPEAVFLNTPRGREEQTAVLCEDGVYRLPGGEPRPSSGFWGRLRNLFSGNTASREQATVQEVRDDLSWPASWNLIRGARAGHSVINMDIKIAYWMGIHEIYAIGMDHNFTVPDTKTGEVVGSNEVLLSTGEINHFHPEYRKAGDAWTMPKLDVMSEEFRYARTVLEAAGGSIKNASRFTKLDAWEHVCFEDIL